MSQPQPGPARTARTIPALSRGLRAVRLLAAAGDAGLSFSELGRRLDGLPPPTLSRLLKSLVAEGYAQKTGAGRYARGPELLELARPLQAGGSIEEAALAAMREFAGRTGESVAFARFYDDRLVLVEKVEVADSFKLASRGYRFPVAANEGPALVVAAHLAGEDFTRFARSADNRVDSVAEFRRLAAATRLRPVHVEPMPGRPVKGGPRRACVAVLEPGGRPAGELHTVVPWAHFEIAGEGLCARLAEAAEKLGAWLAARTGA